jgi:hypothetical protein
MKFMKHTMHINLRLDNNIIPECKTLKHVGIILENEYNSTERTIAACSLIRLLSMSIIKQAIHPSVMNPIVCSKIILHRLHKRNVGRNKGNVINLYWTTNIEIYHDSIFS